MLKHFNWGNYYWWKDVYDSDIELVTSDIYNHIAKF